MGGAARDDGSFVSELRPVRRSRSFTRDLGFRGARKTGHGRQSKANGAQVETGIGGWNLPPVEPGQLPVVFRLRRARLTATPATSCPHEFTHARLEIPFRPASIVWLQAFRKTPPGTDPPRSLSFLGGGVASFGSRLPPLQRATGRPRPDRAPLVRRCASCLRRNDPLSALRNRSWW